MYNVEFKHFPLFPISFPDIACFDYNCLIIFISLCTFLEIANILWFLLFLLLPFPSLPNMNRISFQFSTFSSTSFFLIASYHSKESEYHI